MVDVSAEASIFAVESREVLTQVRARFSSMIAGLAAVVGEIRRPTDLQKALEIDSALAWGVYRAATAPSPLAAGMFVPKPGATATLIKQAKRKGVAPKLLEEVGQALDEFASLVDRHAGERETFDSMIRDLLGENDESADRKAKRAAFRANCQLQGMQLRTMLSASVVFPVDDEQCPSRIDSLNLRGWVGLQQVRQGMVPRVDYRVRLRGSAGEPERVAIGADLGLTRDGLGHPIGMSLLEEYSTMAAAEFSTMRYGDFACVQGQQRGLGRQDAVTYFLAGRTNNFTRRVEKYETQVGLSSVVGSPIEVLVRDVYVHKDVPQIREPMVTVYRDVRAEDLPEEAARFDVLPVQETITRLGDGLECAHTPDVPRYGEILGDVFGRAGLDGASFRVYRCRVEYPVMHSLVKIRFSIRALPSAPDRSTP